jgi:guanylate kinase
MSNSRLLVFIGPSGVGKSSVVRALQAKQLLRLVPSWTTRRQRTDEQDDKADHIFVSQEEFDNKVKNGFFLGVATLFDLPYRYGLPRFTDDDIQSKGRVTAVILRAPLLPLFSEQYNDFVTYQIEDSYKNVSERLNQRQQRGELQGKRLKEYTREVTAGRHLANRVFINNTSIDALTAKVATAIKADFEIAHPPHSNSG